MHAFRYELIELVSKDQYYVHVAISALQSKVRLHMITLLEIKSDIAPCMRKPLNASGDLGFLSTFRIVVSFFHEKL
jgi:hypothetical protein